MTQIALLAPMFSLTNFLPGDVSDREDHAEDTRARRDFINDMLGRNSAAFGSAEDVQAMMGLYEGRF